MHCFKGLLERWTLCSQILSVDGRGYGLSSSQPLPGKVWLVQVAGMKIRQAC